MKKILITLAMGFLVTPAFANSQSGENTLVNLISAKVVVDDMCAPNAVACPAVEPITDVEFEFASCRQFSPNEFVANTIVGEGTRVMNVSIEMLRPAVDCFGPVTVRTYSLQLDDHKPLYSYRFLNPFSPEYK